MNTAPLESKVLANIPEEFADRYLRLLGAPGLVPEEVRRRIDAHLDALELVARVSPLVDLVLARNLALTLKRLHHLHPTRPVVSAAVRYFLEEDEDDEITGVLGFADDTAVVLAVCRALNEEQLAAELLA